MKRLLLLLAFLAFASPAVAENIVGPPNAIFCNKNANSTVTTGTVQLVAGVAGQVINVCGYVFSGASVGTVQFQFGTGTSCTTPTLLTAVFTTATAINLQDHFSYAWATSAQGQSLCAVITGNASASIYFSQF